jgi:ABC transporter, ATP-binding/permease protein
MEFENGYETIVGENGITLSGGQKQRLAIARTLLKDAKIIVFDDSLSSVDTTTDAEIRASIAKIRGKKILIVISHRLSSLMDADKIIVLDRGKVIEEGTHSQLIAKDGNYKRIYEIQNKI